MTENNIELRSLTAEDMFPMFQIISKIGVKEFKDCFASDDVKKAVAAMSSGGEANNADIATIGMTVAIDIAGIIISNIGKCKEDIYQLLAQLSGKNKNYIAKLPMMDFVNMIVSVIKKEEFKDFFQAVSKLLK